MSMDGDGGFVMGSPTRERLVSLLAGRKSPMDATTLSKLSHVAMPVCMRTLEELMERGLVALKKNGYELTEKGLAVYTRLRSA